MNSGSSAPIGSAGHSASAAAIASSNQTSRPSCISHSAPVWRTTKIVSIEPTSPISGVDLRLDRGRPALAAGAVDGDQRLRLGELHPLAHRLRPRSRRRRRCGSAPIRAQASIATTTCGDHRQVDADHVALADPAVAQRVGEALHVGEQLGVGDVALLALLAAPVVGDPVAVACLDVAVEAVRGGVQLPSANHL